MLNKARIYKTVDSIYGAEQIQRKLRNSYNQDENSVDN